MNELSDERDRVLQDVKAGMDDLLQKIRAIPEDALSFSPAENEWTIGQFVAHVGLAYRVFRAFADAGLRNVSIPSEFITDIRSGIGEAKGKSLSDVVALLEMEQSAFLAWLQEMPVDVWSNTRTFIAPWGQTREVSIDRALSQLTNHNQEHLAQIENWLQPRS